MLRPSVQLHSHPAPRRRYPRLPSQPGTAALSIEQLTDFLGHKPDARFDVSDAEAIISAGKAKAVTGDPLQETIGKDMAEAMKGITGSLNTAV